MSVAVITTGGTIAKSYDPVSAGFQNFEAKINDILAELRIDDLSIDVFDLMHADSLDIGDSERGVIVGAAKTAALEYDAVLITHGTDSMVSTGELLCKELAKLPVPIILTGAMIPYAVRGSDAVQNMTEALLALRIAPPGVYIAFHNRILTLPGVRKNRDSLTFEAAD